MKKVLITGAYKNIGFETAKQLLDLGYFVFLGARDLKKAEEPVSRLNSANVQPLQIDITDEQSIDNAKKHIQSVTKTLDVLINNAAISGGFPQNPSNVDLNLVKSVFNTNFFGTIAVTTAFMELLKTSDTPRIVNVTSGLASLTKHNDPNWKDYKIKPAAYAPSKTAINAYTVALAYELKDTAFKVNAVDPGYTHTDFNGFRGTGSIQTAAGRIIKYGVVIDENGPTGGYFSEDNNPETGISPW